MQAIVRNSLSPNLHNTGSNQSDCNFGFTAGLAEALLQSHAGEISLLPALPTGWSDGSITGLRARGGFEVNMQWKGGKLQSAEIRKNGGGACKVRYGAKTANVSIKAGEAARMNGELVAAD
jgi:alpha-L-fucosidase 2